MPFPLIIPLAALVTGFIALRDRGVDSGESMTDETSTGTSTKVSLVPEDWNGWQWPVHNTNDRDPVVSHEFEAGARYKADGSLNYATHLGLDIMFPWHAGDPTEPATDIAMRKSGTSGFIAWPGTPIYAAGPGKVWSAKQTALGHSVQIDHGATAVGGMNTFYQHLDTLAVSNGDSVEAGTLLGTMGGDPANSPHLRHLHFEVWLTDDKPQAEWPTNPQPFLDVWSRS